MRSSHTSMRITVKLLRLIVLGLLAPAMISMASAQESGQKLLQQLIEEARREAQLNIAIVSSQGEKGGRELAEAFKQRFGLDDMDINVDLQSGSAGRANRVIAEHEAGVVPTYDVRYFVDEAVLLLKQAGAIQPIENWEPLLAEIAPGAYEVRDKLSPAPFDGYGFTWGTRTTALLYNPTLISENELPKTMIEYGAPRYKGKFSVPPWVARALPGILKYDKDKWLNAVRLWGQNKAHVLTFTAGSARLLLGEIAFLYSNAYDYYQQKALDSNAPIGLSFFEDLTTVHRALHVVRKRTRHPHAAALFTLWSISEEASLIFQKHSYAPNIYLAKGPVSAAILGEFEKRNIDPVTWFDNQQTLEAFLWYQTPEGKAYAKALGRAQREGK